MATTLRARFDGKALIPLDPIDLPPGSEWDIEVRPSTVGLGPGSPAAVLRAMDDGPHLSPGDANELSEAIRAGRSPVRAAGPFDEGAARP